LFFNGIIRLPPFIHAATSTGEAESEARARNWHCNLRSRNMYFTHVQSVLHAVRLAFFLYFIEKIAD